MKFLLSLILLLTINQLVLSASDFQFFKVDYKGCDSDIVQLEVCDQIQGSLETCTGSIEIVYKGDTNYTLEVYGENNCGSKAIVNPAFSCLEEGVSQNITESLSVTCFTQDPTVAKFKSFTVGNHRCYESREMEIDQCQYVENKTMVTCTGSIDITFDYYQNYSFNVFTNANCSGDPFRVGTFTCGEDGEEVQAQGFTVKCFTQDLLNSSSILKISFNLLLLLILLILL